MSRKVWALLALFVLVGAMALTACAGGETVVEKEVTRVVTETEVVEQEPEVVEVTRVSRSLASSRSRPRTKRKLTAWAAGWTPSSS